MHRPPRWHWRVACAGALALASETAVAHSFGRLYNLPVPFWLYGWGATAALVVSFLVAGLFLSSPARATVPPARDISGAAWVERLRRLRLIPLLRALSLFLLLLCMATGFFGTPDSYRNFNMTFFWVIFVLAFAYLTALVGDLYAAVNPWRVLADNVGRVWRGYARGRFAYPAWLAEWPAFALYALFITLELLGHTRPFSLATALAAYTAVNVVGVGLVGSHAWFRHCEFFAVFLRLTALMAPLDYRPGEAGARGTLRWRWPFAGLLHERATSLALLVFVLFMLSSTAFDGLRATQRWFMFFWNNPWLTEFIGRQPALAYAQLRSWYLAWEFACIVLSPFLYLGVYLLFVWLAKLVARSDRPLRELALDFAYTLLPIALVYNVTHYATLVLVQGIKVVNLASDPFGWGWNLFGTARAFPAPFLPDIGAVWHAQVGLILFGHIVSVVVAHCVALRVFATPRQALLSQLPMLALMVCFTVAGLWILAEPLQAVR